MPIINSISNKGVFRFFKIKALWKNVKGRLWQALKDRLSFCLSLVTSNQGILSGKFPNFYQSGRQESHKRFYSMSISLARGESAVSDFWLLATNFINSPKASLTFFWHTLLGLSPGCPYRLKCNLFQPLKNEFVSKKWILFAR